MAITYKDVIPSLIENTTMLKMFIDGVHKQYIITPCEGYMLRDKDLDYFEQYNGNANQIDKPTILGFYAGTTSVRYDYDFTANPREFYAVLESEAPEQSQNI